MDPDNLQRPVNDASLTHVQRWVMSVLTEFTIFLLAIGLVIATVTMPDDQTAAIAGLNVIAAIFGVLAVAAGLAIHERNPLSPWLLVGAIPGVVGLIINFA